MTKKVYFLVGSLVALGVIVTCGATGFHDVTVDGDLTVTDDTTLTDDLAVGGDLSVTGNSTMTGTVGVTGATTLSSTLAVTGAVTNASTVTTAGATRHNGYLIPTPAVYDTFGEGADKGLAMLQSDGTAFDGTAGVLNLIYTSWGNSYAYFPIVGQAAALAMTATGLNMAGDQTDNDGLEIYGGIMGASGRPFIIGTDPAFKFCASVTIADASGTDDFHIGFRKVQAANATFDNYDTFATIGIVGNNDPGQIYLETDDDGGGTTSTDTTDTWADGASKTLCVLVSGAGVVTYTNGGAAPSATAAFTFDDGDPVIPFIHIIQHGDLTEAVDITEWVVAYQ